MYQQKGHIHQIERSINFEVGIDKMPSQLLLYVKTRLIQSRMESVQFPRCMSPDTILCSI